MTLPSNHQNHKQHPDPQNSNEKTPEKNTSKGKTATPLITPPKLLTTCLQKRDFLVGNGKLNQKNGKQTKEETKESGKAIHK